MAGFVRSEKIPPIDDMTIIQAFQASSPRITSFAVFTTYFASDGNRLSAGSIRRSGRDRQQDGEVEDTALRADVQIAAVLLRQHADGAAPVSLSNRHPKHRETLIN